jgi:hypothetical protein
MTLFHFVFINVFCMSKTLSIRLIFYSSYIFVTRESEKVAGFFCVCACVRACVRACVCKTFTSIAESTTLLASLPLNRIFSFMYFDLFSFQMHIN